MSQRVKVPTAIVHDWFGAFHGSERVVDAMIAGLFDTALPDVYTFFADRAHLPDRLSNRIAGESLLARRVTSASTNGRSWQALLPLMPVYFRRLDLARYRLVIASSHTFAIQAAAAPEAVHVCYCHTPSRYAWLPAAARHRERGRAGLLLAGAAPVLRRIDRHAAAGPDSVVANSNAVRRRIEEFWRRDAVVIHPPVDVDDFEPRPAVDLHFVWAHRLVPHKRPDLVIEAFRGLPYRLTMIGTGMLAPSLQRELPSNVELLSWLPREELARRLADAWAFIHVGEEDFGITMVEALAAGTPVIALRAGGALDIVREGTDGLLVDLPSVEALRAAVVESTRLRWDPSELAARARSFSRERFLKLLRDHLRDLGV